MDAHEVLFLACLSLIAALGLQTKNPPQPDWTGATPIYLIPQQWTVPLCGGTDIGLTCVLLDHPAGD